jgi:hypothetical protein
MMDTNTWLVILGNNSLYAILYGIAYWLLRTSLNTKLDEKLEKAKHDLQLDYERQKIVYEHQKESFKKIISAMYLLKLSTVSSIDFDKTLNKFILVTNFESLYVDKICFDYFDLYKNTVGEAFISMQEHNKTNTEETLKNAKYIINQMDQIYNRMLKHFHFKIGLSKNEEDQLPDIEKFKEELKNFK